MDRGSNVKAALSSEQRLSCTAHMLNTVLSHTFKLKNLEEYGLKEIDDQLVYCRELIAYFKRSTLMEKLDSRLQQFVVTRWNSNLLMLASIEKNYEKITEVSTLICDW